MKFVPKKPKVIISAPFARNNMDLRKYILSLIKHYEKQSDTQSCAELHHFLLQLSLSDGFIDHEEDMDNLGVDVQFENKTVVVEKEKINLNFDEDFIYMHECVKLFLHQQSFARVYEVLDIYCSRPGDFLGLDKLKYVQTIADTILEKIGPDNSALGYHCVQLAEFWKECYFPSGLEEALTKSQYTEKEENQSIPLALSTISDFYHQALSFYKEHEMYPQITDVYFKLSQFFHDFADLGAEEFKEKQWQAQIAALIGNQKEVKYFETGVSICLENNYYLGLKPAFAIGLKQSSNTIAKKQPLILQGQWLQKIGKHLFTLEQIDPKFADDLLFCFDKFFQFSKYATPEFMNKLLFVFEKFSNADLNWNEMKNRDVFRSLITQFAVLYFEKKPQTACLISAIAALFSWGPDKKIFFPKKFDKNMSFDMSLYLKSREYVLTIIVPLAEYKDGTGDIAPSSGNLKSFEIYFTVGRNLINHISFILQTHSSASKLEIKLFAILVQLIIKIFDQLPVFLIPSGKGIETYYIFDALSQPLLKKQAEKLNQLARNVDTLQIACVDKVNLTGEMLGLSDRVSSLEKQVSSLQKELSELRGEECNFAEEGVLGGDSAEIKKRKQTTLEFFAQKKLKVMENSENKTEEKSSYGFGSKFLSCD